MVIHRNRKKTYNINFILNVMCWGSYIPVTYSTSTLIYVYGYIKLILYTLFINRMHGFHDIESGITEQLVGVGTTRTTDDIISFSISYSDAMLISHNDILVDGAVYYIVTKVMKSRFVLKKMR